MSKCMESSRYLSKFVVACGDEAQYLYNLVLKEINVCTETMTVRGTMVRSEVCEVFLFGVIDLASA